MLASPLFQRTHLRFFICLQALLTAPLLSMALLGVLLVSASSASAQTAPRTTSLKEIRERGIVMQEWENSCAAASVATVLTYGFRDPITERYAATKMLEKADAALVKAQGGFSLLDMKVFVESRGYKGSAYKGLAFDDLKIFHAPIVPISTKGYNHYVVFNGVSGNQVLIADPAFGNLKMSREDFADVWLDGMAFVITRPSLVAQADPPTAAPTKPAPSKSAPTKATPKKAAPTKTAPIAPAPIAPTPTSPAPASPAPAKVAPPLSSEAQAQQETALRWALFEWSESWARGDFDTYARAYSQRFKSGRYPTKAQWLKSRKSTVFKAQDVTIKLNNIQVKIGPKGLAEATFQLYYSSRNLNQNSRVRLKFRMENGAWRIQSEETLTR